MQQRVAPAYRAAFFDLLASACSGGMSVFAGQPLPVESIPAIASLERARLARAHNWHFLDPGSPFYQCWQAGFVGWLEDWQPEALIVEANPRYLSTPRAVRWMRRRGRPVLGWGLGASEPTGVLAAWRRRKRGSFLRSLDGMIAYSQRGAEEYCRLGIPADRVFVAQNAAARRPAGPPPPRPGHYPGKPVVLFVGRLQSRKRIDLLLRACASLPQPLQPRLIIVGDGPAVDEFQQLAAQIYPAAEFTGARQGAELEGYFALADLFVLPGTGGLAVQQAMSFGLPVIAAEGDGTQEDLVRPGNGWRLPPGDQQALTRILETALSDPTALRKKGAESFRIVAEEANLEMMVEVFLNALAVCKRQE